VDGLLLDALIGGDADFSCLARAFLKVPQARDVFTFTPPAPQVEVDAAEELRTIAAAIREARESKDCRAMWRRIHQSAGPAIGAKRYVRGELDS
jgi:hypothetical protein